MPETGGARRQMSPATPGGPAGPPAYRRTSLSTSLATAVTDPAAGDENLRADGVSGSSSQPARWRAALEVRAVP